VRQCGVDALHTAGAIEGNLKIGGGADRGDEQRRDRDRADDEAHERLPEPARLQSRCALIRRSNQKLRCAQGGSITSTDRTAPSFNGAVSAADARCWPAAGQPPLTSRLGGRAEPAHRVKPHTG
jgi:hypothetical protein